MGITQTDFFEITAICGGKDQSIALLKSGDVLGWGGAGSGRVSPPNQDICSNKSPNAGAVYVGQPSHFSNVSGGHGVSLGVSNKQPLIWGYCQIGIGGKDVFTEEPTAIKGVSNISKVAAGQFMFAAIDQTGGVYTWGLNADSALGRISSKSNAPPALVNEIPPIKDIVLGDNFMLALTEDQQVYGWGSNSAGQLGMGHLNTVNTPKPIKLSIKIDQIAVGSTHALAVAHDGKVYGWGSNNFGQSGDSTHPFIDKPKPIGFPEKITSVAAGMHYSLALSSSGKVYAWGWNGFGQLGLGDLKSLTTPTAIPGLNGVRAIAAGETHTLAIGKNQLLGWGSNAKGQLGAAAAKQTIPYSFLAIA
jgi:alpha-tubulin suppressor-like RCC1 family protein